MINKTKLLLFSLSLLLLSSCMQEITFTELEDIKIQKNAQSLDIVLFLRINNPNSFKIKIKEVNLDLTLNSWEVGEINISEDFVLKSNSNDVYEVPVQIDIKNTITGGLALISLFANDKADVKIVGTIQANAFFINKTIPVDETKRLEI